MEKSHKDKRKFWSAYYENVSKIKGLPADILNEVIKLDKVEEKRIKASFKKQMELINKYGTEGRQRKLENK